MEQRKRNADDRPGSRGGQKGSGNREFRSAPRHESDRPKTAQQRPESAQRAANSRGRSTAETFRKGSEKKKFSASGVTDNLCWGRNPVLTLLENKPSLCRGVIFMEGAQDTFRDRVADLCVQEEIPLQFVSRDELDALTEGGVHQGIAARMSPVTPVSLDSVTEKIGADEPALIVLMDHCQDPHNLGAVIRTAEIAGAACVICQNDRSATVNGTVIKTSAGAAFRLPVVQVVNTRRAIEELKKQNFWVVGLDHNTEETIWSSPLPERMVLVVGSEGEGISPLVSKSCDKLVKFPMAGATGNLNASVAAALGMFEWVRLHGAGAQ